MKKIVCFHLYNDYSGSPKALAPILATLAERGWKVDLVTSRGGVLDELSGRDGIRMFHYRYRFSPSAVRTLVRYALAQLYTFMLALRYLFERDSVFYINTLLPIGPALAGWLMRKRVVYHYHENAFVKGRFYRALCWLMQRLGSHIICVSRYQASYLSRQGKCSVVPNALPSSFVEYFADHAKKQLPGSILMVGSLKKYKGTLEFTRLAQRLPQYPFELVLNEKEENISAFWRENGVEPPVNMKVYPRQTDLRSFYERAAVVLNLSNPNLFIETFGMTALEAMTSGAPVIVPTVGGIAEMAEEGVTGYHIPAHNEEKLVDTLISLLENPVEYKRMSSAARAAAARYSIDCQVSQVEKIISES